MESRFLHVPLSDPFGLDADALFPGEHNILPRSIYNIFVLFAELFCHFFPTVIGRPLIGIAGKFKIRLLVNINSFVNALVDMIGIQCHGVAKTISFNPVSPATFA